MHVIGHQYIGMQPYPCLLTEVLQKTEIARIISIGEETGGAIMPSLDDVKENAGKLQTGAAGHGVVLLCIGGCVGSDDTPLNVVCPLLSTRLKVFWHNADPIPHQC